MSACDTCRAPGSCCDGMVMGGTNYSGTAWADEWRDEAAVLDRVIPGHPFVPKSLVPAVNPDEPRPYGTVRWSCSWLQADGRCGDYENRPELCRSYQPGQDALCAKHVQTFKGIPVLYREVQP